jgi:hypothetical protein
MARIRSPNYPAISLAEALQRIEQVHARERQHPAAREVILKGMGYNGVHGTSLGALSAAIKYGLLEQKGRGEDYRVSDRAVAILHPHNPEEKAQAIREAAHAPALFTELLDYFKGDLPSDDNLRAYLVRRGFSQTSLPSVIQAFRDTMELVSPDSNVYALSKDEQREVHALQATPLVAGKPELGRPALGATSVSIQDDRIVVAATLLSAQSVQKLIDKLSAVKELLPDEPDRGEAAS